MNEKHIKVGQYEVDKKEYERTEDIIKTMNPNDDIMKIKEKVDANVLANIENYKIK